MAFVYWLLCVLIGLVPAIIIYRSDRKKKIPVKWLPALFRFFIFFLTATLLLAPAFPGVKTEEEKPLLLWLQDNSSSMKQALGKDTATYKEQIRILWTQWQKDYNVVPLAFSGGITHDSLYRFDGSTTNMADALQSAVNQYKDQHIGAVILSGDGIYNEGLDPVYAPLGTTVPIYTIGVGDSTQPKDMAVERVYANKSVPLNNSFEILADVRAEKLNGTKANVSVWHKGNVVAGSMVNVDKDRFVTSLRFEVTPREKGFQRYTISVPSQEGEYNLHNNKVDIYVEVIDEQIKILLLASASHPDIGAIRSALENVPGYKIDVLAGGNMPADVHQKYTMVIAHQYPGKSHGAIKDIQLPVWYILGKQTSLALFNQQQSLLKISGANGGVNEALPVLQPAFNFFILPEGLRQVMEKMPPLQVPYGNYDVAPGAQVLATQQIGQVQTKYPLWIVRTGEQPLAVLCGEGLWRWRMYEYKNFKKHETVDELIRQTVSLLHLKKDLRPFKIFMDKYILTDNEAVELFAELRNENAEPVNAPPIKLTLKDSSGRAIDYEFEKNGSAYRLPVGLLAPGMYQYRAAVNYNGKSYSAEGNFIIEAVPLEQLRVHADYELMAKLAQQTGGQFFAWPHIGTLSDSLKGNDAIRPLIHSSTVYTQWIDKKWIFFIILLLAISEWLVRKYWSL